MKFQILKYLNVCLFELNSNQTVQFFFDAVDVVDILKGVHLFYESTNGDEFQMNLFSNENRVAQALAYGGFLGADILLLPTHQAEVSEKIKKGLYNSISEENHLTNFWKRDLKYYERIVELTKNSREHIDEKDIKKWGTFIGKDLFKAVYFSYKTVWQERLIEIFHHNDYFKLTPYLKEDIEVRNESLFTALLDAFSRTKKRSGKSENNYRDVLALLYLAKKVKLYNNNKGKNIPKPIYFDSQNFLSIIPENILEEYFSFKEEKRQAVKIECNYALRDAYYFKLYSVLKNNKTIPDEDRPYSGFSGLNQEISRVKQSLDDISLVEDILGSKAMLDKERAVLEDKVSTYIDYDFFYTILSRALAKNDVIKSVFAEIDVPRINEERIALIKEALQKVLTKLETEINSVINWSASTFNEIDKRVEQLRSITEEIYETGKDFNVFEDFSLFRFFIPEKYQIDIKKLFGSDGLLAEDSNTYKSAKVSLWNLLYRSVHNEKKKSPSISEEEMFKLFASFWILSFYEAVKDVVVENTYLHHSLLMLKGACIRRAIDELRKENKKADVGDLKLAYQDIISILMSRNGILLSDKEEFESGEVKIALAYLFFHKWLQEGHDLLLESSINSCDLEFGADSDNFKAYNYAKKAFDFFNTRTAPENKHRLYAMNIYLYFIIDLSPDEYFNNITPLLKEFIGLKSKIQDWHFRYDDTIARSFHRGSVLAKSKSTKLSMANTALKILDDTLKEHSHLKGRDMSEIETYKLQLQFHISELESSNEK